MNALVDSKFIRQLYEASRAGVKIDLLVRGICCLRPGVPGVSDNIRVTSIVGRFLEHSRVYYFHNNDCPEVYVGSADLMPRNLDRRVETIFPIEDDALKDRILNEILQIQMKDNLRTRELQPDGSYRRLKPKDGEEGIDSQAWLLEHTSTSHP
jgi:polyphosphate kinase